MELEYTSWQDGDWYLGYLTEYPLFGTQGKDIPELERMLADLYQDIKNDVRPVTTEKRTGSITV
jgi:hypothetical protein